MESESGVGHRTVAPASPGDIHEHCHLEPLCQGHSLRGTHHQLESRISFSADSSLQRFSSLVILGFDSIKEEDLPINQAIGSRKV